MLLTLSQLITLPLAGLLFFTSQSFSAPVDEAEHLVVFGDSLSDTGNLNRITHGQSPRSDVSWHGRASNGPIWVDKIAARLRIQVRDYAYGGATTNNTLVKSPVPSVLEQIKKAYPSDRQVDSRHKNRDIHVIFAGVNDYFNTIFKGVTLSDNQIRGTVTSLVNAIEIIRLRVKGQKFFIPNLFPINLAPASHRVLPQHRQSLIKAIEKHNALLAKLLAEYQSKHPQVRIVHFDLHLHITEIIRQPKKYGLENTQAPCVNEESRAKCANPNTYFFWDQIHLTTRAYELLASAFLAKLPRD